MCSAPSLLSKQKDWRTQDAAECGSFSLPPLWLVFPSLNPFFINSPKGFSNLAPAPLLTDNREVDQPFWALAFSMVWPLFE